MKTAKTEKYAEVIRRIKALIGGERDEIAVMATVVSELHNEFEYYDWTGFYRVTEPDVLKIGPYQGTHGCLVIPFSRGICGAAARSKTTQLVPDVSKKAEHIACSSSTQSEIVLPVFNKKGDVKAVLDIDSDTKNAFDDIDRKSLEEICRILSSAIWS